MRGKFKDYWDNYSMILSLLPFWILGASFNLSCIVFKHLILKLLSWASRLWKINCTSFLISMWKKNLKQMTVVQGEEMMT